MTLKTRVPVNLRNAANVAGTSEISVSQLFQVPAAFVFDDNAIGKRVDQDGT